MGRHRLICSLRGAVQFAVPAHFLSINPICKRDRTPGNAALGYSTEKSPPVFEVIFMRIVLSAIGS